MNIFNYCSAKINYFCAYNVWIKLVPSKHTFQSIKKLLDVIDVYLTNIILDISSSCLHEQAKCT